MRESDWRKKRELGGLSGRDWRGEVWLGEEGGEKDGRRSMREVSGVFQHQMGKHEKERQTHTFCVYMLTHTNTQNIKAADPCH